MSHRPRGGSSRSNQVSSSVCCRTPRGKKDDDNTFTAISGQRLVGSELREKRKPNLVMITLRAGAFDIAERKKRIAKGEITSRVPAGKERESEGSLVTLSQGKKRPEAWLEAQFRDFEIKDMKRKQ